LALLLLPTFDKKTKDMKAAVINAFGEVPQYLDFPDPVADDNSTPVTVKASVLENFDKVTASGTHYSSQKMFPQFPAIIGSDGIGITADGRMVGFRGIKSPYGAFAEIAAAGHITPIPDGIDPARAAAMPRSALTSLLPLKYSAKLQPGETVLINGATGVSGRIAVQVARMLGAGKVVATGRNAASLKLVKELGADEVINLEQGDAQLGEAFIAAEGPGGYDVVLDFLWGHPAEVLINTFLPKEAGFAKRSIRYLQIGEKAGSHISLHGSALRTSGLQMMGIGKISNEQLAEELARVWEWIKADKLYMEIERIPLANIAEAWQRVDLAGKRLVIVPA
jgi:NADPH:quinone reductase-like Zn-dependent oxidoreductase